MIKLFSGYTIVLFLKGNVLVNGHNCIIGKREGKKLADCKGISIVGSSAGRLYKPIPNDLDSDIECLDFSSNAINELKEDAFEKYGNLIWLSLHDTTVEYFANDSFKPLAKLEELDISALEIFHGGVISIWPPKIRKLNISNARKTELNVVDLAELELIDVSRNNDMEKLPVFNTKAPLHTVILDGNKMNELAVEQLAPYCHINNLSMKLHAFSEFTKPSKYCNCVRLQVWTNQFNIRADGLECQKKENEICDEEFSEEMLTLRRKCIGEKVQAETHNFLFILVIVFLILFTLIPLAVALLYIRRRDKNAPESDSSFKSSPSEGEKDEKPEDDVESETSGEEEENVE